VVVHQDQRRRPDIKRTLDHVARMDRGLVQRAFAFQVIKDQAIAGVEIEHPHPLMRQVGHVDRQVIDQGLPAGQHRLVGQLGPSEAPRGERDDLQRRRAGFAHARVEGQRLRIGIEYPGQAAEPRQQALCERFHVLARDCQHQQVFDHLVIGEGFRPPGQQPRA